MERDGISRWHRVLSARMRRRRAEYASAADVVLLDTALGSENSGDQIIMQACDSVCFSLWGGVGLKRIPTHYYVEESERLADKVKILCGTNIIWKKMEEQVQWALPNDLHSYQNVCLLGTGLSDVGIEQESSLYTKLLYHTLLSQNMLHSVRDERAKQYLKGYCPNSDNATFVVIEVEGYKCVAYLLDEFHPYTLASSIAPFDKDRLYPLQGLITQYTFKRYQ